MNPATTEYCRETKMASRILNYANEESGPEKNMSVAVYNENKVYIRHHLCNKSDPNAVLLRPGVFPADISPRAVRDRIRELDPDGSLGYSSQRGYKLIEVSSSNSVVKWATFNAQSQVVVKHPNGTFESMTKNARGSDEKHVFVPSSRVHTELTDEQILSGYFLLSTIIGGPPQITAQLMRLRVNMCAFEQRRMCAYPEEMMARKSLAIRQFPGYVRWATTECRLPDSCHIDVCIAFGMPFRELRDDEVECMLSDGDTSNVLKDGTSISDLVNPVHPWAIEETQFVSTAHTTRQFLMSVIENDAGVDDSTLSVMLVAFYRKMEIEYAERLAQCECRCKEEYIAKHSEFK